MIVLILIYPIIDSYININGFWLWEIAKWIGNGNNAQDIDFNRKISAGL